MPTEQCNFRCVYCYEDFAIGKMSQQVQSGVINLIRRRAPSLSALGISWFGGEPMLAMDVISFISENAKVLCTEHSVKYRGSITTNGALLTERRLEKLCNLGISDCQISLDGWGDVHDRTRVRLNGSGTFKQIWRNLLRINEIRPPIQVTLRLHVTKQNHDSIERLITEIIGRFDRRIFRIFIKAVEDLGGNSVKESGCLFDDPDHKQDIVNTLKEKANLFTDTKIRGSGKIPTESPYICYASKANSFIIRATGAVGKCTVALKDPRNCVGQILTDGQIRLEPEKVAPWLRGLKDMNYDVLGCPLHGLPALGELAAATRKSSG